MYAVPTSAGVLVVRHFVRGGSVARFLGDRYLSVETPRPFREATASERIRDLGIETPRVVAAAVYRAGLFYRGDLVTELVPQAQALSDVLFDSDRGGLAGTADRKDALRETGALISRMARAGVRHPDLNAGNVLVQWSGGTPTTYVIDLDRATVDSGPVSPEGMVQRLLRSLRKFERQTGLRLPEPEQDILVAAARTDVA